MKGCNWTIEMNCVFCWQHYDRSSGAADSNIQDEVKKVMNILYHRLQPQFMPSTSYDGLQIRHIFMATIRVYQNLLTFLVLVFKWITQTANCLVWIVTVCQSSHNICTNDLTQDSNFLRQWLLGSILGCNSVSLGKWFPALQRLVLPGGLELPAQQHSVPSKETWLLNGFDAVFDSEYETPFRIHQQFKAFHDEGTVDISTVNC